MGQISINYDDAKRIIDNPDAGPDSLVIAACTIAFFQVNNHTEEIESSTRAIALKLTHMIASAIYILPIPGDEEC